MSGISYEVDYESVLDVLDRMIDQSEATEELFSDIGIEITELTRQGFTAGLSPYGDAWKSSLFRAGQPLRDTGRLMNSITFLANGEGVDIGTNVCHASIHQFGAIIRAKPGQPGENACGMRKGTSYLVFKGNGNSFIRAKEVNIPARPFLADERGLPENWKQSVLKVISRHFGF